MANADLKFWGDRKSKNGKLNLRYPTFARQAWEALGYGGIVAVPNARPDEYRYEELLEMVEASGESIERIGDGGIFYDTNKELYVVKAQEVNTKLDLKIPLTFLVYGLSPGKNLPDENADRVLREANDNRYVIGLNGVSCAHSLEKVRKRAPGMFGNLDFFVVHQSASQIPLKKRDNKTAQDFYDQHLHERIFTNPFTREEHKIGQIAVSGGHRTPRGLGRLLSGPTVGSSYVELNEDFESDSTQDPFANFRNALRNSQDSAKLHKGRGSIREAGRHAVKCGLWDPISSGVKKVLEYFPRSSRA